MFHTTFNQTKHDEHNINSHRLFSCIRQCIIVRSTTCQSIECKSYFISCLQTSFINTRNQYQYFQIRGNDGNETAAGRSCKAYFKKKASDIETVCEVGEATDSEGNPLREDLEKFKSIKEAFRSKVYVVNILKNYEKENLRFTETTEEEKYLDISFEYPVDADISHGLDAFIKMHSVKMLVMMPHIHNWVEKLFRKSKTQDMIFHTHIPLLILPDTYI